MHPEYRRRKVEECIGIELLVFIVGAVLCSLEIERRCSVERFILSVALEIYINIIYSVTVFVNSLFLQLAFQKKYHKLIFYNLWY